ncbi:tastin [Pelodytes ibericus]
MASTRETAMTANHKSFVFHNSGAIGKENVRSSPKCPLRNKEKQTLREIKLNDPQKSKLPVLTKTKVPPDFQKMHQAWQNQFQKGKAVSKKSCTRPQPFNLSQKGDRFRVTAVSNIGNSETPSSEHRSHTPLTGNISREPAPEVYLQKKDLRNNAACSKDVPDVHFKADPAALASILSNAGVSDIAGGTAGKLSLAQRVPMRMSSAVSSVTGVKSTMFGGSMYTKQFTHPACSNLERMSCFSRLPTKGEEQRIPCRQRQQLTSQPPDTILKEFPTSKDDCILQSQVNPLLQQMNISSHIFATSSQSFTKPEIPAEKPSPVCKIDGNVATSESTDTTCENVPKTEKITTEGKETTKDTNDKLNSDPGFDEFVADSQALASILSNIGVTVTNVGKLSLAQRVPVQAKNVALKSTIVTSGSVIGQMTPKKAFGRMSNMLPLKDVTFSPCRVLKPLKTPSTSSEGSARRTQHDRSAAKIFSKNSSLVFKQPVFPKTPKALALEMANKCLEAEFSGPQRTKPISSSQSSVKWADDPSPTVVPKMFYENKPDMEQVAVQLFTDVESTGDADQEMVQSPVLKTTGVSDPTQSRKGQEMPDHSTSHDRADASYPQAVPLHLQLLPLRIQELASTLPHVPSSSSVQDMRTSLPLSFLTHPAVQALQSSSCVPHSLPHIARLRLHATVSAKKKFWDTCLDDECAFYTSVGVPGPYRSCKNPVASSLEKQENMHFIPISSGESRLDEDDDGLC